MLQYADSIQQANRHWGGGAYFYYPLVRVWVSFPQVPYIKQTACCMHAMQEHLITDPLGAASRFLAHTHPLCLVLISDLYLCSCWPSHIQTTVLDSCTLLDSPRLSQALPDRLRPACCRNRGSWTTDSITENPVPCPMVKCSQAPSQGGARRQHPPRSTTAAISRKQGGWQISPAQTQKSLASRGFTGPTGRAALPSALCAVSAP